MGDDQTFRIILALGLAAVLPFGIYHRLRSQATREMLDRRQEGLFILLSLRPIGLAAMGGLLTFVVNPALMAWSSVPLLVSLRWAGVGIGLLAGSLFVWTFRILGTNITDTVVTRRHHTLVTTGPVPVCPAPVLCRGRPRLRCQCPGYSELVHRAHGGTRDDTSRRANDDRGGASREALRRGLPAIHEADRPVLPVRADHSGVVELVYSALV